MPKLKFNDNSDEEIIKVQCIYCSRLVPDPLLEKHMGEFHNWTSELING